jgi:tRNA A-37 threonylcarbamoyl transferase component Bud32
MLPIRVPLVEWDMPNVHQVLGLHRHVVQLVELGDISYVAKELPDHLAQREFRLLREIAEAGLPTAEMVAVVTDRPGLDGMVITRHLDYSLPYRVLLAGRGLDIPYLGERLLDALVSLLVRLHLSGFYWGDCSLSNTLFRRDAGALSAFVIDTETAEWHDQLTPGQRSLDLSIATENVAGGLLDLQMGGRLQADIDPWDVGLQIEDRYHDLWNELTAPAEVPIGATHEIELRLRRLHDLGFDVDEMELVRSTTGDCDQMSFVPKVVEHGYHSQRLKNLTGLETTENQARRLLDDIHAYTANLRAERERLAEQTGRPARPLPDNVAAVRWLDDRFEPIMEMIPIELFSKLEPAEIFHQLLEHRWFKSEESGRQERIIDFIEEYIADVLAPAPDEVLRLDDEEPSA